MNKTLKKALIFFLLLIIVVLVIFVIQLYLPTEPSPTPSASPSGSTSPTETVSPSQTDDGSVVTEETADGTKYIISVPGTTVTYSVVVDSAAFSYAREDGRAVFTAVSDKNAFVSISFVEGRRASDLAPGFLNPFIDYTSFEQSGENEIPGTTISGETVAANDGNTQLEAWLVDTNDGVLAVFISYTMSNKDQEIAQLEKIVATLTIAQ